MNYEIYTDNQLIKMAETDKNAVNALFYRHKSYLNKITKYFYKNNNDNMEDLIQESYLIFLESIQTYNSAKNMKFTTYFYNQIFYNKRHQLEKMYNVKIPYKDLVITIKYKILTEDNLTDEQLLEELNININKLKQIKIYADMLDKNYMFTEDEKNEHLIDKNAHDIESEFNNNLIEEAIKHLDPDTRTIIQIYYGFTGLQPVTSMIEIARMTGIKKKVVIKLFEQGNEKIREFLLDNGY